MEEQCGRLMEEQFERALLRGVGHAAGQLPIPLCLEGPVRRASSAPLPRRQPVHPCAVGDI